MIVKWFPVAATVLIEMANASHVMRMFRERSSAGHSAMSWVFVILAVVLWEEFYRIRTPKERIAIWTARVGIVVNVFVLGAVLYFR